MKRVAKRRRRKRKVKLERRRKKRGKLRMILLETKITTPLRTNKVWLLSQFSSFSFLFAKMTRKLLKGAKETNMLFDKRTMICSLSKLMNTKKLAQKLRQLPDLERTRIWGREPKRRVLHHGRLQPNNHQIYDRYSRVLN